MNVTTLCRGENAVRGRVVISRHAALVMVSAIALLSGVLVTSWGCSSRRELPPRESATASTLSDSARDSDASESASSTSAPDLSLPAIKHRTREEETWDAVYLGSSHVGFSHTVFDTVELEKPFGTDSELRRITNTTELRIQRYQEQARIRTQLTSWETAAGRLRCFKSETQAGPSPIVVKGVRRDDTMHVTTVTRGKQVSRRLPWEEDIGGLFAVEQSLRAGPMQPGEQRTERMLMPGLSGVQVVTVRLQAKQAERVELLESERALLKIEAVTEMGGQSIASVYWTSQDGKVLKMELPGLGQTSYRTTEEQARPGEAADAVPYDLGSDTIVRLTKPLPHPHELLRAEYEVRLESGDPHDVFDQGHSQRVEPIAPGKARVTVFAVRPDRPLSGVEESGPGPAAVAANSIIQSDDPAVLELAAQATSEGQSTWQRCIALEQLVHDRIEEKNYGRGFATAADVARDLSGDCTEHAVLLAAVCRARDIPARVALGLVYSSAHHGFAFHMWTEAWVNGRWIPLDATLGKGGVGGGHLKLNDSSLAGENAENAVLSVLQVINQLELELISCQPN